MKHIIGDLQSALIPGRSINENCVLAHDMLNFVKQRKKKDAHYSFILNLDLNKAYDRISWAFVEKFLRKIGLSNLRVYVIMQFVSSVSYQVLVNREPSGRIIQKAGLRQGDPLSPYIFILCMESLSMILILKQKEGNIRGLKIARDAPQVSHMFFLQMTPYSSY